MKKPVSVIVPAFNEESCIDELARRLKIVFLKNEKYDFEALIIENGSTDRTWEILKVINAKDPRFKVIRLAKNFGMDGGITAGLNFAKSDAVVFMTADLQDPPELISEFIKKWEDGFENVYMLVTKRVGTGPIRTFNSKAFYWLAGKLTDNRIPKNVSDYRLLDRKVYEAVRGLDERNRFVRGLVAWVGFRSVGIEAERPERFGGESKAYSLGVIGLAFKGIFAHSYIPLRLITMVGVGLSVTSFVFLMVWIIVWMSVGVPFAGFGTIVSVIVLAFGTLTFMLGIVAEYLGLIYEEVKGRPNFIVSEQLGMDV